RVAPTFLRFGNFEILAARGEADNLQQLVDWTIEKYYPHIGGENKVSKFYKEVVESTANLMVEWLRVGFVHGVMNTDNMSIPGLTIDYGPYSFLDNYDLEFTPNTTDLPGRRYAFGRQASIAKWNLGCLGGALLPLLPGKDELVKVLDGYDDLFWLKYYLMLANKIGLDEVRTDDTVLFTGLEKMLAALQPDMTIFYQLLGSFPVENELANSEIVAHFNECFYSPLSAEETDSFCNWIIDYSERIRTNKISRDEGVMRM
ncbi:MAG: protein adenylyltransferase SelO family protein, partial [Bacteroidota bacterium]|nr:protein adenylyltransferase SelO family protein [Bacteroidota bacterium]